MASLVTSQSFQPKFGQEVPGNPIFQCSEITSQQRKTLLRQYAKGVVAVPELHLDTVKYRRGPSSEAKDKFRAEMLNQLRRGWTDPETERLFLKLADFLQVEGCALFAGLIDVSKFEKLIQDYGAAQENIGSRNFLHSFVNLAGQPSFIENTEYNDAFVHPLLVALIAYRMGGSVRIIDVRGKDTDPLSANAQDNMFTLTILHFMMSGRCSWFGNVARPRDHQDRTSPTSRARIKAIVM